MKFDKNYFTIKAGANYDYDIPAKDLNNAAGLEKWLCHLTEKNWFNESMANQMIKLCENKFGYIFSGKIYY